MSHDAQKPRFYKLKLCKRQVDNGFSTTEKLDILHVGEYDENGKWIRWMPKEEFFTLASENFIAIK
jgi:hypothetical protein